MLHTQDLSTLLVGLMLVEAETSSSMRCLMREKGRGRVGESRTRIYLLTHVGQKCFVENVRSESFTLTSDEQNIGFLIRSCNLD